MPSENLPPMPHRKTFMYGKRRSRVVRGAGCLGRRPPGGARAALASLLAIRRAHPENSLRLYDAPSSSSTLPALRQACSIPLPPTSSSRSGPA